MLSKRQLQLQRRTVEMLLDGDQAGLTRLANQLSDQLHGRVECPACRDMGPHEDNGESGEDRMFACDKCGECWDAVTCEDQRAWRD